MRVEKDSDIKEEMKEMKQELSGEIRSRTKKRIRPKCACLLIVLALIIVGIVFGARALAKTGLVEVPVFSKIVDTQTLPSRIVSEGEPLETFLKKTLTSQVASIYKGGNTDLAGRAVSITVQDTTLTNALRVQLRSGEQKTFNAETAQIAVSEKGVEVYLPLAEVGDRKSGVGIIAVLVPKVESGKLAMNVSSVTVGTQKIPTFAARLVIEPLMRAGINMVNEQLVKYAALREIRLGNGSITIEGDMTIEILELTQ